MLMFIFNFFDWRLMSFEYVQIGLVHIIGLGMFPEITVAF